MEDLRTAVAERPDSVSQLCRHLLSLGRQFLLRSEVWDELQSFDEAQSLELRETPLGRFFFSVQEAAQDGRFLCFALRPEVGRWSYVRLDAESLRAEEIGVSDYLAFKERLVGANSDRTLEFDIAPFQRDFPRLQETRSIGRGVEFLNRKLSSQLFYDIGKGDRKLLDFLRAHTERGQQLMLNGRIHDVAGLRRAMRSAMEILDRLPPETPWAEFADKLAEVGLEPGWGATAARAGSTIELLSDLLEAPEPGILERFLSRVPMIFSLVILSPHGYFGQRDVLGRPDTGGQIVYILDQVRALEKEMRKRISEQGLDIEPRILIVTRLLPEADGTTCDQRIEAVEGTENATILRVPFTNEAGETVPHWISRFEVWPYLERFSYQVEEEITKELGSRPDLIVGNYSDGNLVATLLAQRLGVTQCNIAHALEKTKYLYSDLYWRENDAEYHFSSQFTADLIAMNAADFIITSTYQEIAGTSDTIGQYESYSSFPMPDLYRVVSGVDVFDPKFNIVSPGADADVYFPYTRTNRRHEELWAEIDDLIDGDARPEARGKLEQPEKPLLFTMARLDRIKNIAGLVEWYGASPRLRNAANLLVIAGAVDPAHSGDKEEQEQIQRMHELFDRYQLDGQVRWLGTRIDKKLSGELYRRVADRGGAFVQPALFEAFGLTVIEAMGSGLPTFATRYGGPLEIVQHGVSGFHIDPNHGEAATEMMAEFFEHSAADPNYWRTISDGSIQRVLARYTWSLYADRMMTLSRVYGFWKHVTNMERAETRRYLEMFYKLQLRPLAESIEP